jgi:predicted nucleic acid-binding protein
MAIFVDTWGWAALLDEKEPSHSRVSGFVRDCFGHGFRFITSNFVVGEAITLLFSRLKGKKADRVLDRMMATLALPQWTIEEISQERFQRSIQLRRQFRDKPDISFTDLTTMVVMRELGITDILTGDQHFAHVNLGFRLVPER